MNGASYPIAHFDFMRKLVDVLEALPAELLEHQYSAAAFGSWRLTVRCRGRIAQLSYDGREEVLSVCHSSARDWPFHFHTAEEIDADERTLGASRASVESLVRFLRVP